MCETQQKPKSIVLEVQNVTQNISDFFTAEHVDRYTQENPKSELEKVAEIINKG